MQLLELIEAGEHIQQDFKFQINDARKIARSLSAFANTLGGRLLIGVKDNGVVAGVRSDEEYYMAESAAQMYSKPEVKFETKIWKHAGKTVLEVTVPSSNHKPHFVRNADGTEEAFIRIHDENIKAPQVLIRVWQKENQERGSLIRYSKDEEALFHHLDTYQVITISKFQRVAKISRKSAIETLANLIVFGLIEYRYSENTFLYKLCD